MTFLKSHSPSKHFKSFKYAFSGILHALYHEANFRIQILITLISIFLGIYFQISAAEWSVLILSFSMLLSSEVINTSIENLIDFVVPKKSPIVKIVKDLSAGFVLINALA
ncbi:diacylglycerol kinase family protein, partial [bacterium]|nr:diacylglycerol kinase family protein [bacterium]